MHIDNNIVVELLRTVKDPNTGRDLIAARMIEDLRIEGENIFFSIVLKHNDQNVKSDLNFACIAAISDKFPNAHIHPHIKIKSDNIEESESILPQVKNIIAVASGKGGVGKSTISVNLAAALAGEGYKTGLVDADLYGPSIPTMLGVQGQRPRVEMLYGKHKIVPIEAHGMSVMSIGFIVEPEQAVVLRGPRLAGLLRQFLQDCLWPDLDFLIIDLPPGTGDVQLTLVQTVPVTGAIMVTTPQDVAVADAVKAMNMFLLPNVNVPVLGVVENMSWFTPAELPDHKYYLFGQGGGAKLAAFGDTKLLGQVPLVQSVREGGDSGKPVAEDRAHILFPVFKDLTRKLNEQIRHRNMIHEPTRIVKMQE